MNWDHIYKLPWPVVLETRKANLKRSSTHREILAKIMEPAPGPVFVLGVHLCGVLSIKAVDTFNRSPKCVGLVLKPCCLPGDEHVKMRTQWTLGAHVFDAKDVCCWGRYNRNRWRGPFQKLFGAPFRRLD